MQYSNRFIILSTQIMHVKQTQKIKKAFWILHYSILKSTAVQSNGWDIGAGLRWAGKSYWQEEGEEMGDGRVKGCQQQEMEGKLQFHSCLTLMEHMFAFWKFTTWSFIYGDLLYRKYYQKAWGGLIGVEMTHDNTVQEQDYRKELRPQL